VVDMKQLIKNKATDLSKVVMSMLQAKWR